MTFSFAWEAWKEVVIALIITAIVGCIIGYWMAQIYDD